MPLTMVRKAGRSLLVRHALTGRSAAVVGLAVTVIMARQLAENLDYASLAHALRCTHWSAIAAAMAATGASFGILALRDSAALREAGTAAPARAIGLSSLCGTAISNTLGCGGLSAAAVRYRIYGAVGVAPEAVASVLASISIGFALGLTAVLAVAGLAGAPGLAAYLGLPVPALQAGGALGLGAGTAFLTICGLRRQPLKVFGLTVRLPGAAPLLVQVLLSVLSLSAAAAALWLLLPRADVDFPAFLAIFAAAVAVGGVSHVPGGLGVFEAVVLYALRHHVPVDRITAALLMFRVVYFVLPLVGSTALLAAFELRRAGRPARSAGDPLLAPAARLVPTFLAALTFGAGAVLVGSGATPAFHGRLSALASVFPLWAIETADFSASVAGLVLLFVSRGLFQRSDAAWWCAVVLTPLAVALSLVKGLAYTQASLLAILFIVLLGTHGQFPRRASLWQPFTMRWWLAVGAVLVGSLWLLVFANAGLDEGAFWQVALDDRASRALRAMVVVCTLALALGLAQLLGRARPPRCLPSRADLDRALGIIAAQGRGDALLAMMGDKSLLFSGSGRSFLMFADRGRSSIALYDPVGPRHEWAELIGRFLAHAADRGNRAAFYHVRPDSLSLYIDAGLQTIKLGEEARVDLGGFDLAGARRSHLRYALKRGAREGLTFEMLAPGEATTALGELDAVSRGWLDARGAREKGFSVAAFSAAYLAAQSVALVRSGGRAVAFASLMRGGEGEEATVGLMRHLPEASPYAMEFLFVSLILALKQEGCASLSLGTAPLSGLSRLPLSSRWHLLGHLVWRHGTRLYNFQGLKTFKGKFDPQWEPRYLAVSGSLGPYLALADAAVLSRGASLRSAMP